jgi:hypothetical protein
VGDSVGASVEIGVESVENGAAHDPNEVGGGSRAVAIRYLPFRVAHHLVNTRRSEHGDARGSPLPVTPTMFMYHQCVRRLSSCV